MSDPSQTGSEASRQRPARKANIWSTLSIAIICAALAYVTQQLVRTGHPHSNRRMWTPIVVTAENQETVLQAGTRRLEFWTPSGRTREYLGRENGAVRERDKWEAITNEEPVQQFGVLLKTNSNVLGYRRAEVWGHGRTSLKPGWWWTMTVTTDYSLQNLVQTYRSFWKSTNALFIERIENPGEE